MLFEGISLTYIFGPVFLIGAFVLFWAKKRSGDTLKGKIDYLKTTIIVFGSLLLFLWLLLPSAASLSTFGYPESVSQITNKKHLLDILQDSNKAIVRTTQVVHWLLFIFIFWFLSSFYEVLKYLKIKEELSAKRFKNKNHE